MGPKGGRPPGAPRRPITWVCEVDFFLGLPVVPKTDQVTGLVVPPVNIPVP